uniref:CBS domain-containing protein n=1 Tax=Plectus sambesii TaxID=2011161 RepID=A0A914VVV4_9BILA
MVGLTLSLGSGLPIGKEGPFVHVASVVATLLAKATSNCIEGLHIHDLRYTEMLATACAVGVACTFSAPIGGVLFSIEVTSVHFAVRNYWRGFFAAACSTTVFSFLRLLFHSSLATVEAFSPTHFPQESFIPQELPIFGLLGVVCGLAAAFFIIAHRHLALFYKQNDNIKRINQKSYIIIPILVSLLVSLTTFPGGYGKLIVGRLRFKDILTQLFEVCTFYRNNNTNILPCNEEVVKDWTNNGEASVFLTLSLFMLTYVCLTLLCSMLPIPAGIFIPVFVIGAAFGRLSGELIAFTFPNGLDVSSIPVYPGVYAIVCAAAFCGAVTHTVSISVIVFELTGQIVYLLPVVIAVLIANAVCAYFQPSIYDSMIDIKKLPHIPHLPPTSSLIHDLQAKDIMISDIKFIAKGATYIEVKELLESAPHIHAFPMVEDEESMILIGCVSRSYLSHQLKHKIRSIWQAEHPNAPSAPVNPVDLREASVNVISQVTEPHQNADQAHKGKEIFVIDPDSQLTGVELTSPSNAVPQRNSSDSHFDVQAGKNGKVRAKSATIQLTRSMQSLSRNLSQTFLSRKQGRTRKQFNYEFEQERLRVPIVLEEKHLNRTPLQVVEYTSLYKMYSLFHELSIHRVYVTHLGRLIGVIGHDELRVALEGGAPKSHANFPHKAELATTEASSSGANTNMPSCLKKDKIVPPVRSHVSFVTDIEESSEDSDSYAEEVK